MHTLALAGAAAALAAGPPVTTVRDVFPRGDAHSQLRAVDPVTFAPAGPAVPLRGFVRGWTRSPAGGRLALGVSDRGRLQIVDVHAARTARLVATGRRTAWWLLAWPHARRLLALGYGSGRSYPLVVVDPARGRVVRSARVSGYVTASAPTRDGLALLVAPPGRIADAELVLIDAAGRQRRIALPGVVAGLVPPTETDDVAHARTPGLAVRDGTAFVASATEARVVEVDLASGARRDHVLGTARTAKRYEGSERQIAFVGPHQLAVAGTDTTPLPGGLERQRATGLRLVDTRTWGVRLVSASGRGFTPLPAGGLAFWRPDQPRRGLVLLDGDGRRRATVLRGRPLVQVQFTARHAYAVATRPRHRTWVIDLRSGRIVNRLPTARPGILVG